jgi:hypothetical protein
MKKFTFLKFKLIFLFFNFEKITIPPERNGKIVNKLDFEI